MRATARVVASRGPRLTTLYGEAPLLPRQTGPAEVHLVGGAAGPLGGDCLRLELEVEAGAELCVRSVAATLALPGLGGELSRIEVRASVGPGGRLEWLPEPLIAAARCRHETLSTVDLAAGASLVWREELVCGRHGEEPGDARLATAVRLDGRPLYVGDLAVGPSAPAWSGPAVLGGARVYGSVLLVPTAPFGAVSTAAFGAVSTAVFDAPDVTVMKLTRPGVLITALGADLPAVRRSLGG